jgi:hypothetical protein
MENNYNNNIVLSPSPKVSRKTQKSPREYSTNNELEQYYTNTKLESEIKEQQAILAEQILKPIKIKIG